MSKLGNPMRSSSQPPGAKALAVDDSAGPEDPGDEDGALETRDQAAIPSELETQDAQSAQGMEPVPPRPRAPRGGSKLLQVIELLRRDRGANIDELIAATGWLAHTTRAALTGLRKRGYTVVIDRSDKERGSFYRIAAGRAGEDNPSVARLSEGPTNSETARKPGRRRSKPQAHQVA